MAARPGSAAALSAARRGVDVTLIDSNPALGGQIWRQPAVAARTDAPPPMSAVRSHPRIHVLTGTSVVHAAAVDGAVRLLLRTTTA